MGDYQTNCYILRQEGRSLIIDPGMGATPWVKKEAVHPVAILNTHGHFDHVWSNDELHNELNIPIYTPEDDVYLLTKDPYGLGQPPSKADICVQRGSRTFEQGGFAFTYHHVPGHTPGCSIIEIGDAIFSGDFIFKGSIGRTDFPKSSPEAMFRSIQWFMDHFKEEKTIFPGHGPATTVSEAREMLPKWLHYLS